VNDDDEKNEDPVMALLMLIVGMMLFACVVDLFKQNDQVTRASTDFIFIPGDRKQSNDQKQQDQ